MMQLTYLLAAAVVAVAPLPAAPQWFRVSHSPDATWYVDLDSVRTKGPWTAASEISVYRVAGESGTKAVRMETEYDCGARKIRYLRLITYDASGAQKEDQHKPGGDRLFDIRAGTPLADIADYVCGVKRDGAVRVEDPMTAPPYGYQPAG